MKVGGCGDSHISSNIRIRWKHLFQAARSVFGEDVVQAPLIYVDGKHIFVYERSAESGSRIGARQLRHQPVYEARPDEHRDVMALGRINVPVKQQCPQQHFPMHSSELENALPINFSLSTVNDMSDIGSVKSLSSSHKKLGGQQLLSRQNSSIHVH